MKVIEVVRVCFQLGDGGTITVDEADLPGYLANAATTGVCLTILSRTKETWDVTIKSRPKLLSAEPVIDQP